MDSVAAVRNLETELKRERKATSAILRSAREQLNLTLREVGYRVNKTPGALLNLEQGKSWRTETAATLAKLYDRLLRVS